MDELLLDTTYLLPILGVRVNLKDFENVFPSIMRTCSLLYNPVSLVEAKWVVLKLAKDNRTPRKALLEAYRIGLKTLLRERRLNQTHLTDNSVEETADALLLEENLGDYFDRLIYATAFQRKCALLTEDKELRRIAERSSLCKLKKVVNWEELLQ